MRAGMSKAKKQNPGKRAPGPAPLPAAQVVAVLNEAAIHRVAARYDEAIALYESLERTNPRENDPPYFLALIDLARHRPVAALERLAALTRRAPEQALVWLAYAHALRELGRWRESIAASRRALALTPLDIGERFSLANALEVAGDLDAALAEFRSIMLEESHRMLALTTIARRSPEAIRPEELDEIHAAAQRPDESPEFVIMTNVALGAVLERQGRHDEAFEAFARAARIQRGILAGEIEGAERPLISEKVRALHPAEAERLTGEWVSHMKSLFTREFIAEQEGGGQTLQAPIFIVGFPRSGSTLVEQILSSHRRVQGLGEAGAMFETIGNEFPLKFLKPHGHDHYRQMADRYLAAMHQLGWTSSARFIDKDLGNHLYIGVIHLMFPKARILHTVRDPVDTCFSNFRTLFLTAQEQSYDLAEIGRAYVQYRQMMEHWDKVLPGRVIEVDHEALVADPEARIRWLVTQACGLEWDEACLAFHKTKRPVRTASVAQVRQPIFTTSVQRWRRYEKHLGPLLDALGPYAPPRELDAARLAAAARPLPTAPPPTSPRKP